MKSILSGYYQPIKDEFEELWKSCIFAFDASVLLDLYRSTEKTRNVFLNVLEKIGDRIWIPYQAAWEYQENRLEVITKERELYVDLKAALDKHTNTFKQQMKNHAIESAATISSELDKATEKISSIIKKDADTHPDLSKSDHIREKLTKLFEGRTGMKYQEQRLTEIFKEGEGRFERQIPPGYQDRKKEGTRRYGDLVVWREMLDWSKSKNAPIVFVTSDLKEDWWWRHGQFTVGPRPELVQEMKAYSGQRFYMYNLQRFLAEAQKHFKTNVESGDLEKAAAEFDEIQQRKVEIPRKPADLSGELNTQPDIREKLRRLSATQWSKLPVTDMIKGVSSYLRRPLDIRERNWVLNFLMTRSALLDQIALTTENVWDVAELIGGTLEEAIRTGVYFPNDIQLQS
jgi:hypothetical protein